MSERLAEEVISLPMHAYLDEATQDRIIAAVRRALGSLNTGCQPPDARPESGCIR